MAYITNIEIHTQLGNGRDTRFWCDNRHNGIDLAYLYLFYAKHKNKSVAEIANSGIVHFKRLPAGPLYKDRKEILNIIQSLHLINDIYTHDTVYFIR